MRDLGTLGGEKSRAFGVNSDGCVVGTADTANGTAWAFLWTPDDGMTPLDIPWAVWCTAGAINDCGQVVGNYADAEGKEGAFIWTAEGGARVIETPYHNCSADDINYHGQVLVTAYDDTEDENYHIMVWSESDGLCDLGSPYPEEYVEVCDLTESGCVIGSSDCPMPSWMGGESPFVLPLDGKAMRLPSIKEQGMYDDLRCCAHGGNGRGQVVGEMVFSEDEKHAWLWTPRDMAAAEKEPVRLEVWFTIVDKKGNAWKSVTVPHEEITFIESDGEISIEFAAIDLRGRRKALVIPVENHISYSPHAERTMRYILMFDRKGKDAGSYIWHAAKPSTHIMTDLGTLGGRKSWALDINEKGQVVGGAHVDEACQHAFLWSQENGMIDLGTLGGQNSVAGAINDSGVAVGWAEDTQGHMHACVWGL